MKENSIQISTFISILSFFVLVLRASSDQRAGIPPRGWNSYDSFCWTISEKDFLDNAQLVKDKLFNSGYQYAIVDYLWYRKLVPSATTKSGPDLIDNWGRPQPDPDRWPSAASGNGFKEVADKVHGMGLKFGIHVMAGLSVAAFNSNTPILDPVTHGPYQEERRTFRAKDIALPDKRCKWMPEGFMAIDASSGAGKAFLRSLYGQYADWGVDFVKLDCVFGDDLKLDEITEVSQILQHLSRPIVFSLSPGAGATPALAKRVSGLVNMYRISGDTWDKWSDLLAHFDVARDFAAANLIGAGSVFGSSWPDLDMLPFGWITNPETNEGPHRWSNLTTDEQKTQMTLWAMARSPLMFGGDMRKFDNTTYNIIANPDVLRINALSGNNKEFPFATAANNNGGGVRAWIALGDGKIFIALFNLNDQKTNISAQISDIETAYPGMKYTKCDAYEIWSKQSFGNVAAVSTPVERHGTALFALNNCK